MVKLKCKYCGGEAIIEGKCVNAKVRCLSCGIERPAKEYLDEIEKWKELLLEEFACLFNQSSDSQNKND
ncbi:MAG: hypothetical protein DRP29_10005 [Thermodesulfobacteriota bacterium]|nr:MAG: hypothetical protein DRP29_10005 [Thermodesulfobacteriota bacterium]RLG13169.1 MAG: hypothetical protein DRN73_00140 [Candidatus Pacearchaeota archaeon]